MSVKHRRAHICVVPVGEFTVESQVVLIRVAALSSNRQKVVAVPQRGRLWQLGKQSQGCRGRRTMDTEIQIIIQVVARDGLLGDGIDELLGADGDKACKVP